MVQFSTLHAFGALFATTYFHLVSASAAISVGLTASFSSAPYLIELLETAGDENATSYFPLIGRIADGYFKNEATDQDLYETFVQVLLDDGHMDAESLSSYNLALSLRTAAPRIEAHYQYYHTTVEPTIIRDDVSCPVWVLFGGKKYCSPELNVPHGEFRGHENTATMQFDRIFGNLSAPASIIYGDITSPLFGHFHKLLIQSAQNGKTSYRIRHSMPVVSDNKPLVVGGYGVELALKRTDYIVIDDRDAETQSSAEPGSQVVLEDEEVADLKPLSKAELAGLGLKASSFILQSDNPLSMLARLSQDFPRYSTAIAAHNVSAQFVTEHEYNRKRLVPSGMNVLWINGLQIPERQVDAFSMLDIIRKERKLMQAFRHLGLSGPQAIDLLSHSNIATSKAEDEPQRFDWRDITENGETIIWLNNIEKDKRYQSWGQELQRLLQRTYPGQLPQVRRDIFNLVLPVDLSNLDDVELIVEQLSSFVKRKLPLRFGLVPITKTDFATQQAKIAYYLLQNYGIAALVAYLEAFYSSKAAATSVESTLEAAIRDRTLRAGGDAWALDQILSAEEIDVSIKNAQRWVTRLGAHTPIPPLFVNGVAMPRNENWLQLMSQQINADLQAMQRAVYESTVTEEDWAPEFYLRAAASRRNPLIVPESSKDVKVFDMTKLYAEFDNTLRALPTIPTDPATHPKVFMQLLVIVDATTAHGKGLLTTVKTFHEAYPWFEVVFVPSSASAEELASINEFVGATGSDVQGKWASLKPFVNNLLHAVDMHGKQGLLLNGRFVGPISNDINLTTDDLQQLFDFERVKRIDPVLSALKEMELLKEVVDSPATSAKLTSMVELSFVSDVPEGIFEQASTLRIKSFDTWKSNHTAIEIGDATTANIRIVATIDPASQVSQRWIPILKVVSEMEGVYVKLFLNPRDRLSEIPIKRFYRYVVESKPSFNPDGSLRNIQAEFKGVPREALLTVGMDVPAPWLVAPKDSIHDLDNIKLSSIKGDVHAMYELQHILIEGHSHEATSGQAPRGAQLLLGTARDPHFADTIIMANLGYFQFKANPGSYKIGLQEGRSSEIFDIDTLGISGRSSAKRAATDIVLMSFQGVTLFPQLSRKKGQESEDVLETKVKSSKDYVSKGLKKVENLLGLRKAKQGKVEHAEINIFSVASGHLYERMLDIMMVSVMKHTKHSVKFWFIEQFLSPSFKASIPALAAEYGFDYEMVTYKWPHWLRAQTEKQREIWGYKILFLDVLFPLSLDKVIFVDADQIVRTDMIELVNVDLQGAPYGFTPMCDSRTEMEGFRFWKQGYWANFLNGLPYHISALYVVDLRRFRAIAAGDRLRQQYHQLSADPASLSNLDQDLPNHMQSVLPIYSLPQEWLWCETWCSDESLAKAKTIDLCNNPMTKEPKLDRARRQVPEWTAYDDEISAVLRRAKERAEAVVPDAGGNPKSRTLDAEKTGKKDEL